MQNFKPLEVCNKKNRDLKWLIDVQIKFYRIGCSLQFLDPTKRRKTNLEILKIQVC